MSTSPARLPITVWSDLIARAMVVVLFSLMSISLLREDRKSTRLNSSH